MKRIFNLLLAALREIFDEILSALPVGAVDPHRLAFEEFRRANKRNPASKH